MNFRETLQKTLSGALGDNSSDLGAKIVRDCLELLTLARDQDELNAQDLDLPGAYIYADILTEAGLLEKRGSTSIPTNYKITEAGRSISLY